MVLNPHTPLEIFLPPSNVLEVANIHLLMASNWDGLNSGAFGLRVHPWSVSILSAVLAYPLYKADKLAGDRFRDQSAFQWLLQSHDSPLIRGGHLGGTENWADVPMRWFNSLPINNAFSKSWDWIFNHNMTGKLFDNGTKEIYPDGHGRTVQPWKVMRGDMLVHFAGTTSVRDSWMTPWLERAEQYLPEWSNVTKQVELKSEAEFFWNITANRIFMGWQHEKEKGEQMAKNPALFRGKEKPIHIPGKNRPPVVDPTMYVNPISKDEAPYSSVATEAVRLTRSGPVEIATQSAEGGGLPVLYPTS